MSKLTDLLNNVLHQPLETSSPSEIVWACQIIARAESLTGDERDTLLCAFNKGPLWDGDVPSKSARSQLVEEGYMARVVVKGEDGFNACTYKGAWLARVSAKISTDAINERAKALEKYGLAPDQGEA